MLSVNAAPASWQAGLWILSRPLQKTLREGSSIDEVCQQLGIGRSAAYEAAELLSKRMTAREASSARNEHASCEQTIREQAFEIGMLRYQVDHPGSMEAGERVQYDPAYKAYVEDRRAHFGITRERASQILNIPLDTLKKFPRSLQDIGAPATDPLPSFVIELVNEYLRVGSGTKSIKTFCKRNPELLARLEMNYRQVLNWLRELGFVSPRGIFLKNKGLDKILLFKPNQVWCSDGKRLLIAINGKTYLWLWQCLVDGKTTIIVGGLVAEEENTANLLAAIQESKARTGISPLAIVLDNRLSENLPAIRVYLDELGIEIIKIFPGNSKSNGIVEGNFNIFDRWVGKIVVNGTTPEELSRSIANVVVEIFTQMRNRAPRAALSFKSAQEVADEAMPATPEEVAETRAKLKALADRFKQEQARPEISAQKKVAIEQAAIKTAHPDPKVLESRLSPSYYTADLILQSIAIFERQKSLHPEKKFNHSYFGGILRNLVNQKNVEALNTNLETAYVHHWDTLDRMAEENIAQILKRDPIAACNRLAEDFMAMPVPAYSCRILLDLKEAFLIASKGSAHLASTTRNSVAAFVLASKKNLVARREALLCKLFEWENFIRLCDRAPEIIPNAPGGHA